MSHDIFISYSRKDPKKVIAIRDEIKETIGAESWIDIKGIESGEQFVNVIIDAIDKAKVVLFMISASSMQSEYTKKEIMYTKQATKKNHAASEYHLGLCYLKGRGVQKDELEAKVCFRKALKQGYEEAKKYL